MESTVLPVVKNKVGDFTDVDNRAIALSSAETKILEYLMLLLGYLIRPELIYISLDLRKGIPLDSAPIFVNRLLAII